MDKGQKIKVTKNGPYAVTGAIPLREEKIIFDERNYPSDYQAEKEYPEQESYSLCRCGHSKNQPFCDSAHVDAKFDGTETADNIPYGEQAKEIIGPDLILKDAENLCSGARFCHKATGTWQLTKDSDDPDNKAMAIESACKCTAGRLTACDKKTSQDIEPNFKPAISVIKDHSAHNHGPLRVNGGVQIESADGEEYEQRNRVALCRCGLSDNKPLCDGSHFNA